MSYSPPTRDAADFELAEYTPPARDAADFNLQDVLSIAPPRATLTLDALTPSATGEGRATVTAPTATLSVNALTPSLRAIKLLSAPTATLSLDALTPTPDALSVSVSPDTATLTLDALAPSVGFPTWLLDNDTLESVIDETVTPDLTTLTFRVSRQDLVSTLRPLRSDEGKYRVLPTDSGAYVSVDTADGSNTYELIPPVNRTPLRQSGDVHVDRYEEELVAQDTERWDVTLEVVPDATRDDDATLTLDDQTPGGTLPSGWWQFDTTNGPLALSPDRVSADVTGTGDGGVDRVELTLTLTFEQAHTFETALKRSQGTRIRDIEDATNRPLDETDAGSNTLDVTSPTPDVIESGAYVVVDGFESVRKNERFQKVSVTILPA